MNCWLGPVIVGTEKFEGRYIIFEEWNDWIEVLAGSKAREEMDRCWVKRRNGTESRGTTITRDDEGKLAGGKMNSGTTPPSPNQKCTTNEYISWQGKGAQNVVPR